MEYNGGRVTTHMTERAVEGIRLWEELLEANQIRMLVDGLQFYSTLSQILGNAVQFGFTLDASKMNGGVQLEKQRPVIAHFAKREHIDKLFNALTNDKVKDYGSKYF